MAKVKICTSPNDQNYRGYLFFCPGCGYHHAPDQRWEFNGDVDRPTLSPSVLVNGSGTIPINPPHTHRCHSFVRDGKIQFLSDCTHALAGQTLELPDIDNKE